MATVVFISTDKGDVFIPAGLSVCLSATLQKTDELIFTKFSGSIGLNRRNRMSVDGYNGAVSYPMS